MGIDVLEEIRPAHIQDLKIGDAAGSEVGVPIEVRRDLIKVRNGHLVLLFVGIAALDAGKGGLGKTGLHAHHDGGIVLGGIRWITHQFKEHLNVQQITLASFLRFGVVCKVVIAVGKPEAALGNVDDDFIRVVRVLGGPGAEKN